MPSFITSLQNLISDATTWIMGLAVLVMVLMVSYHALMRTTAQDEHSAMQHTRSIKNVLMYGVVVIIASALVKTIAGYF